jgi:site-specific recombinase XerD
MSAIRPERARAVLPQVDPARLVLGWPVGLRDGALLALIAAGLSAAEICALPASAITMERGNLLVTVRRHGILWKVVLPTDLGARLPAWLTESRLWADPTPVLYGPRGPLTRTAIHQILHRYRRQRRSRRFLSKRKQGATS